MQALLTGLIVAASAAYVAWALMPSGWRRALARRLTGREPAATGGCGGCDGCTPAPPRASAPITLHRRPPGG